MKESKNINYKITDLKIDIAQNDDIVKINQIIANLEDINEQDESSYTALIWAVYRNNLAIVKALLTHPNIDVNKANNDGDTALIWAAHRNNLAIVKALLTHPNIDVNKANNDGDTALYFAAHRNNLEMLQALLFHRNIDIDLLTDNIASALDYGVLRDNPQIIKDVIAFGADEGSLSDQQRTQYQDVIAEGKTILIERNTQDLEFRLKDTGRALAQISSHNFKNIAIEANAALWKNLPSEILAIITSFAVSGRVPNKFTSTEIFHYTIKDIDSFLSQNQVLIKEYVGQLSRTDKSILDAEERNKDLSQTFQSEELKEFDKSVESSYVAESQHSFQGKINNERVLQSNLSR